MTYFSLGAIVDFCAWYWEGVPPWLAVAEVTRDLAGAALLAIGCSVFAAVILDKLGAR